MNDKIVDLSGKKLSANATQPMPHEPNEICDNCHFAAFQGEAGTCRANPPSVVPLPQQDRLTGGVVIAIHSIFPSVMRDTWCCCFEPNADLPE
jgi:hypothetical protein